MRRNRVHKFKCSREKKTRINERQSKGKWGKRKKWNIRKEYRKHKNKMVETNPNISITIKIIGLNSPVIGHNCNTITKQNTASYLLFKKQT